MLTFSANIEMFAPPIDFYDRFAAAHQVGFSHVEFWSWEQKDLSRVASICKDLSLGISSISGDGSEFSLCDDRHQKSYIEYARASIEAAHKIRCKTLVIHSNALDSQGQVVDSYADVPPFRLYLNMLRTLELLVPYAEQEGVTFVLEPLNIHVDHRGNALNTISQAAHIIESVGSPRIQILYDMYHMQIEQGNLIQTFRQYQQHIGLIHIADNPGRHEPGTGEINYATICKALAIEKYKGVVAFELSPETTFEAAAAAVMSLHSIG